MTASLPKLDSDADKNKLQLIKETEQKLQELSTSYDAHQKETTKKVSELKSVLQIRKEEDNALKEKYDKM